VGSGYTWGSMRHTLRSRATAFLLAALFMGSVGGASDLDALLFHRVGMRVASGVSHLEPDAATQCHAERCLLALRLANGRVATALRVPVRFEGIPSHAAATQPVAAPHRFFPGLHQQSRAPPASLA
jgi:hypothetical protein